MVYLILLNWNGWRDTIQCLHSLLCLSAVNYRIVVCDNASTDGSLQHLSEFLSSQTGYCDDYEVAIPQSDVSSTGKRVYLLQNGINGGYAAGNNAGIRFVRQNFADVSAFWLLNNDTKVVPDTLSALVRVSESLDHSRIVGSVLLSMPTGSRKVQMAGGTVLRPLGFPRKLFKNANLDALPEVIESDYVSGASLFVPVQVLDRIGLMDEHYFLYWEETDWCFRYSSVYGLKPICARASVVYHREGASVGFRSGFQRRLDAVNKVKFMRRYGWQWLPTAMIGHVAINVLSDMRARRFKMEHVLTDIRFLFRAATSSRSTPSDQLIRDSQ